MSMSLGLGPVLSLVVSSLRSAESFNLLAAAGLLPVLGAHKGKVVT